MLSLIRFPPFKVLPNHYSGNVLLKGGRVVLDLSE